MSILRLKREYKNLVQLTRNRPFGHCYNPDLHLFVLLELV